MAGAAVKITVSKKSFLLTSEALPADVPAFVARRYKSIVVRHLAVTFFASDGQSVDALRIKFFNHFSVLAPDVGVLCISVK